MINRFTFFKLLGILFGSVSVSWIGLNTFIKFPNGWIQDDAFFYAQIAYNIGTTYSSSFDSIHQTSGYHLLWGWFLGFVSWLVSWVTLEKTVHLGAMVAVYFGVCFSIALLFGKVLWQRLLLLGSTLTGTVLMETILLSLFLLICTEALLREKSMNGWRGMVLVLIPLTRIDVFFIPMIFSLYYLKRREISIFILYNTLVVLGMVLHFGSMWILFENFVSVSSLIKTQVPSYLNNLWMNFENPRNLTFAGLAILGGVALWRTEHKHRLKWGLIFGATILYMGIHYVFNNNVRAWYFFPSYLIWIYLMIELQVSRYRSMFISYFVIMMLAYFGYKTNMVLHHFFVGTYSSCEKFVEEVRKSVPEDNLIFQVDGSGYVGFFSERKVINGDGMVNNYEFLDFIKSRPIRSYLKENHIGYIITNNPIERSSFVNREDVEEVVVSKSKERLVEFRLFKLRAGWSP